MVLTERPKKDVAKNIICDWQKMSINGSFIMKALKVIGTIFCALFSAAGIAGTITGLCTGMYGMMAFYLVIAVLFAILIALMWARKKPESAKIQAAPNARQDVIPAGGIENAISVTTEYIEDPLPDHVIKDMQKCYTVVQAKNDLRIINDCLNLIETTKNLDTFFSRYDLGLQTALTLKQAEQAKVKGVHKTQGIPDSFQTAAESQKIRVLNDYFFTEKEKIENLVTPKAKLNHWKKCVEKLEEYESHYEFDDEYQGLKAYATAQIELLQLELASKS